MKKILNKGSMTIYVGVYQAIEGDYYASNTYESIEEAVSQLPQRGLLTILEVEL